MDMQREQASEFTTDLLEAQTTGGSEPMSTIVLPAIDPRGAKAVALATDAGQWLKCRTRDGRKAYGVPSSEPNRYYLTTRTNCTCPAYEYGYGKECKHILAVQLHCDLVAEHKPVSNYGVIPAHLIERED